MHLANSTFYIERGSHDHPVPLPIGRLKHSSMASDLTRSLNDVASNLDDAAFNMQNLMAKKAKPEEYRSHMEAT